MFWLLVGLLGCSGPPTYIVEGTVVEVGASEVVIDHEPIEGFMGAMTMPFAVEDRALIAEVKPGHRVIGRIAVDETEITLEKIRVTGWGALPMPAEGPLPLEIDEALPATELMGHHGEPVALGAGQGKHTVLTFVYTRCPDPDRCPATLQRLQALQEELGEEVRLVALTLDPEHDTVEVLAGVAEARGADPARWVLARTDAATTRALAMRAGLPVTKSEDGTLVHQLRWLALDAEGRLRARWEDNRVTEATVRAAFES